MNFYIDVFDSKYITGILLKSASVMYLFKKIANKKSNK